MEKAADEAAELGEFAVLFGPEVSGGAHIYIVPRYKMNSPQRHGGTENKVKTGEHGGSRGH
jgi:hypothetical protein